MELTMEFPDGSIHSVHRSRIIFSQIFTDALLAFLAIAASEIFKEGERLQRETDLTI